MNWGAAWLGPCPPSLASTFPPGPMSILRSPSQRKAKLETPCVCPSRQANCQLSSAQLAARIGSPCSLHEKHDTAATAITKRHPSMGKVDRLVDKGKKEIQKKCRLRTDVCLVLCGLK